MYRASSAVSAIDPVPPPAMRGLSSARCLRAIVLFPAPAMIALGHCATGPKPCWYMHGGRFTRIYGDAVGPEEWRFLTEPGAAGLLRTLPEACRDRALAGCLMRVINAAAPPEPIIEACRELGSDPSEFAAEVAFIRILQGRMPSGTSLRDGRNVGSTPGPEGLVLRLAEFTAQSAVGGVVETVVCSHLHQLHLEAKLPGLLHVRVYPDWLNRQVTPVVDDEDRNVGR